MTQVSPPRQAIALASETDWAGFRAAARQLLAQRVPPHEVDWRASVASGTPDLFASSDGDALNAPHADYPGPGDAALCPTVREALPPISVPASFVALAQEVILHSDPSRFALLYRLLWRLIQEPGLRHDVLDPDMNQARLMRQAVHRDLHKMKAFVRFRERPDERFVAWFEPAHHIVEAVAPFFARRFTAMRWAIFTPRGSVAWDGQVLQAGPPATRQEAEADDTHEALWLTYYAHIFNPARLKLNAMRKEMPKKYWHNLPEARLIAPLSAAATHRSEAMIAQPASSPRRRLAPKGGG